MMMPPPGFGQVNAPTAVHDVQHIPTSDSLLEVQQRLKNLLLSKFNAIGLEYSNQQTQILQEISVLGILDNNKKLQLEATLDSLRESTMRRELVLKKQIDSIRAHTIGIPIIFDNDTLFHMYTKLGPFSPSDRAESIVRKLKKLVEEGVFDPSKLMVHAGTESHDIMHDALIILSVTDRDAFWLDISKVDIATQYTSAIKNSVVRYAESTGLIQNLKRTGLLILVLLSFVFAVIYMNKGFTWLNTYIFNKGKKHIAGITLKNYELLSVEREEQVLRWFLKVTKWFFIAFTLYLLLPIVFSIFPSTKGIATTLISYVLDPLVMFGMALIGYIPELITIIVIVTVTNYFVRFLKFLSREIAHGKLLVSGFYADWAIPTFNLVRIIVYAFSFIIIFPYLPGSDSNVFKGVSVFLGILFSLGSSSAISNIIAGLVITYMRAFKIGDRVKIGDTVGDVMSKSMLVTRLRTIDNEDVTIPNSSIMNGSTVNYSSGAQELGLIIKSTVTIGYDVPWRQVHQLLIDAAQQTDHIKSTPTPFVLQTSLDDFYVSYQIKAYTDQPGMTSKIYSQLHSHIQDGFKGAGVEIMSPHYRGNRDGSDSTIPGEYNNINENGTKSK
jgi:small-conductance mechanosensitive channel